MDSAQFEFDSLPHTSIFTLANNFLSWTYFWPTRFRHRWTTLIHTTLCVTDKRNSWLADITFDWCHVRKTAAERYNQTHWFISFLRRLFYQIYIKPSYIMNKNNVKTKWSQWVLWKVNVMPLGCHLHLLCTRPIAFILWWMSENKIYFLNECQKKKSLQV